MPSSQTPVEERRFGSIEEIELEQEFVERLHEVLDNEIGYRETERIWPALVQAMGIEKGGEG